MSDSRPFLPAKYPVRNFEGYARRVESNEAPVGRGTDGRGAASKSTPFRAGAGIAVASSGLPGARLKRILAFIDEHLNENIAVAELARNAGLSVFHFSNLFKKSTGFSPYQYILHRRVHRARFLLENTNLSVLDVSLDLGFQHQNNFARAFRRITGMTPTRFRREQS